MKYFTSFIFTVWYTVKNELAPRLPSVVTSPRTMAVRPPTRTITRTYLYLDRGRFPALVRRVDKQRGVDLKHVAKSLRATTRWIKDVSSPPLPSKKRGPR